MSRIYLVLDKKGAVVRYVRANTLNAAVRAHAAEKFTAKPATTDDVYHAMTHGADVLDVVAPEQMDIDDKDKSDPGPVPLRAV